MPGDKLKFEIEVDSKTGEIRVKKLGESFEKTGKKGKDSFERVSKSAKESGKQLGLLTGLVGKLGAAFGAWQLARWARDWAGLAGVQQKAVAGMEQALRSMGRYTPQFSARLQDVARSLQGVTTFGDETTIAGQKFLITYKDITDDLLPRTSATMLDLAALMGGDVKQAANMLGKASMGMAGELRRVGITIDPVIAKSGKFADILAEIEKQVGGQARALADTEIGRWEQLANIWGDSKESLGEMVLSMSKGLVPVLIDMAGLVTTIADKWVEFMERRSPENMLKVLKAELERLEKARAGKPHLKSFYGGGKVIDERIAELKRRIEETMLELPVEIKAKDQPPPSYIPWRQRIHPADWEWDEQEELGYGHGFAAALEDMEQDLSGHYEELDDMHKTHFDTWAELSRGAAMSMQGSFSDFFFDVMTGEFKNLEDLGTGVLRSLQRGVADMLAQGITSGLLGSGEKGSTGALWSGIKSGLLGSGGKGSTGALWSGIKSGESYLLAAPYHEGGVVGDTPVSGRIMPRQAFAHAKRYHSGLAPDEIPAILQRGETVYRKGASPGAQPPRVVVNIINKTGRDAEAAQQGQPFWNGRDFAVDIVLTAIETSRPVQQRIASLKG